MVAEGVIECLLLGAAGSKDVEDQVEDGSYPP